MMSALTIGQVARHAGVGVETVRFYEREGLLLPSGRRPSGYRVYHADAVRRLAFIRRARDLGFTLREIRELLALSEDPEASRADLRARTEEKITEIESRIQDLRRIQDALRSLTAQCDGTGGLEGCPILHALQDRPHDQRPVEETHHAPTQR